MSTRPERVEIDHTQAAWDGDVDTNFEILLDEPLPPAELTDTLDETDLEAEFAAAAYRNCIIWVYTTGLVWVLYYSNGTTWVPWASTFSTSLTSGVAATTMSGNQTLTSASQPIQFDDPNGGNRDVTLDATNHVFARQLTIVHTGSANTLTVKDSGGGTLAVLSKGQTGIFTRDVSAWRSRTVTSATSPIIAAPNLTGTTIVVDLNASSSVNAPLFYSGSAGGSADYTAHPSSNGNLVFRTFGASADIYINYGNGSASGRSTFFYDGGSGTLNASIDGSGAIYSLALTASTLLFATAGKKITSTVQSGCLTSANLRTMLTDDNAIAGAAIFSDGRAVSGSKISGAALIDLLTKLTELGIITDATSA